MNIYQMRVSIMGIPRLYRIIEISDDLSFYDLHKLLFVAFDREEEHLFSFYLTGKELKPSARIYGKYPEITHPRNVESVIWGKDELFSAESTRLADIHLSKGFIFHYLFDFGDNWLHRIRVQDVEYSTSSKSILRIVKSVGASPEQYPDFDDEEDDDWM